MYICRLKKNEMNKKAVITGATRGMGRAIAMRLGAEGYDLAIIARSAVELENFKSEALTLYKNIEVLTYTGDLSLSDDAKAFATYVQSHWKKTDVLVNNAGMYEVGGITDAAESVFEKMMNVNFFSSYYLTKSLCGRMQEAKSGHIFNVCSIASKQHIKGASYYTISKHAMLAFSNSLREELRSDKIKVTSILPGATYTSSWDDESLKGGMIQSEDIASSVMYALSLSHSACVEEISIKPIQFNS